jgi:type I restriction enzyme S subunit
MRLKYVARIYNGQSYQDIETDETGYPVYGSGGIFAYAETPLCTGESVLLGRKGTIGKPLYVNGEFWTVDTMYYTVIKSGFLPKYVYYVCTTIPFDFFQYGSAVPSMTASDYANMRFAFPSLEKQTAIAAYLDHRTAEIDALLADLQSQAEMLDRYKRELIAEVVTKGFDKSVAMRDSGVGYIGEVPAHWDIYRFRQLFNFGRGISITKADLQDEGIPCVTYGDIHSRFGFELRPEIHAVRRVDGKYAITNPKSMLQKGDFVFADTSEDVAGSGNFTYLNSEMPSIAGYHTIVAKPRFAESSRFLAYVFDSVPFRAQIRSKVYGIKVFSITQAILKNARIPFPPIDEQKQIAEYLDKRTSLIKGLIADITAQIGKLKQYRQIVIHDAVTGKIKVTEG